MVHSSPGSPGFGINDNDKIVFLQLIKNIKEFAPDNELAPPSPSQWRVTFQRDLPRSQQTTLVGVPVKKKKTLGSGANLPSFLVDQTALSLVATMAMVMPPLTGANANTNSNANGGTLAGGNAYTSAQQQQQLAEAAAAAATGIDYHSDRPSYLVCSNYDELRKLATKTVRKHTDLDTLLGVYNLNAQSDE